MWHARLAQHYRHSTGVVAFGRFVQGCSSRSEAHAAGQDLTTLLGLKYMHVCIRCAPSCEVRFAPVTVRHACCDTCGDGYASDIRVVPSYSVCGHTRAFGSALQPFRAPFLLALSFCFLLAPAALFLSRWRCAFVCVRACVCLCLCW